MINVLLILAIVAVDCGIAYLLITRLIYNKNKTLMQQVSVILILTFIMPTMFYLTYIALTADGIAYNILIALPMRFSWWLYLYVRKDANHCNIPCDKKKWEET